MNIDGIDIDPYFIMSVTQADSEEFVTKAFKKKAKIWHPDRATAEERNNPAIMNKKKKHFKILIDSYQYIINRIHNIGGKNSAKFQPEMQIPVNQNIPLREFVNPNDTNQFNMEFENSLNQGNAEGLKHPNDFGYHVDRLASEKEYEAQNHQPYKLFDDKQFNQSDFNKAFEYSQEQSGTASLSSTELGLYHKTTDGFNAYNSGDLGGAASVSSYNGLMIVGDNFAQNGQGYFDSNYSDYGMIFNAPKNPNERINVPTNYQGTQTQQPMSASESKRLMQMRQASVNSTGNGTKGDFKMQEQMFLERQKQDMLAKINQDKNMILNYGNNIYNPNMVTDAMNNSLETSKDYVNENNVKRRYLNSNPF